uniref:Uncharacterized protein n=1 Tax=Solanum lycopersicum TaxID=4081 RepID=A0A3Q7F1M0_SOLLC
MRKGANEKCADRFLIPTASNGNSAYAGDVGRQMAEVGSYPMNDFDGLVPGKHASVVKNDAEQTADSMMRVLKGSANEVLEETMNHILAETRMVDFKRRRETNRTSEQSTVKLNKEEETNANEHTVLQNAQGNSSQTAVAKDSADKPFKRRKLVRPVFDENNCRSDLNHQLPCQTLDTAKTAWNSNGAEVSSPSRNHNLVKVMTWGMMSSHCVYEAT